MCGMLAIRNVSRDGGSRVKANELVRTKDVSEHWRCNNQHRYICMHVIHGHVCTCNTSNHCTLNIRSTALQSTHNSQGQGADHANGCKPLLFRCPVGTSDDRPALSRCAARDTGHRRVLTPSIKRSSPHPSYADRTSHGELTESLATTCAPIRAWRTLLASPTEDCA